MKNNYYDRYLTWFQILRNPKLFTMTDDQIYKETGKKAPEEVPFMTILMIIVGVPVLLTCIYGI